MKDQIVADWCILCLQGPKVESCLKANMRKSEK